LNYTQAYKALRAAGCSGGDAVLALDRAEIAPSKVLGTGWLLVRFSAKTGFTVTDDEE
jgi:hypothetical protein